MMSMHTLGMRMKRDFGGMLERGHLNTAPVTLRWVSSERPADENVEGSGPEKTVEERSVHALVHFVGPGKLIPKQFVGYEKLDALVTFEADVELSGLNGLTFVLPDGFEYVQADSGERVVDLWDAVVGGEAMSKTVALNRVGGR